MRLSSLPTLLSGLLSCLLPLQGTTAHPSSLNERHHVKRAFTSVDDFKTAEYPIALSGLFANIGPSGSKAGGSAAGVVLASPSKSDPDYWYTWIRDASLVYKYIIDRYVSGRDTTLLDGIKVWVNSMAQIQQVSNPSGTVSSGGLGEPKFNADMSAFTGGWGRPQRDGPALRSISMITLANKLLADGSSSYVTGTLWPIILLDLNYVANNWNKTGFDLWEEVNGASFFTTAVQHRSLRQGIALATALGDPAGTISFWTTEANNALCFLQSYWSGASGFTVANVNPGSGAIRSGKDSNTVLTSIHTFDPAAGCDDKSFQPCSPRALANLKVYVDSFRSIYTINNGIAANQAVATGRYPEDSYYGGNPWYLCTFAVAEQLYRAIQVWNAQGQGITVTSVSLPFFQQFDSSVAAGTIAAGSTQYTSLISSIKNFADGFMLVAAKYTPSNGALAEQYTRAQGTPISAADLTWSYAAVLTAFDARDGLAAESWGVANLTVPSTCSTGGSGGGGGSGSAAVLFKVTATTNWGQNIYVTGSIDALSNWGTTSAIGPFDNAGTYPVWTKTVSVPASTSFSYKYIKVNGGNVVWESDPNRSATAPAAGATLTLTDTWR